MKKGISICTLKHVLILAMSFVLLIGCQRENPYLYPVGGGPGVGYVAVENTDTYHIEYQFSDVVIRFEDDRSLQYIIAVEEDGTVILDADLPQELHPVEGSILSADVSDVIPFGLGNRVLSVEEVEGKLICETEVAAFDEVFSILELSARIPVLTADDRGELVDSEGTVYETGAATISEDGELVPESRITLGSPDLLCINLPGKATSGFFLTGQIAFGAVLVVNISLSKFSFEISLEPSFGVNGQVGFRGDKTLKELWGDAFKKDLFPKSTLVNGVVQVGPVTLRPYVDIYCYVNVKIKGEVNLQFSKASRAKFGWTEKGAFKENKASQSDKNGFVRDLSVDGRFVVEPEVEFDLGMGLWTKRLAAEMIPTLSLEVGADLELTNNENTWRLNPNLVMSLGGEASGRVLIDMFKILSLSREMSFLEWELFHWEWPLLPVYMESSADVSVREGVTPLTFDASYALTGGLMSKFGAIYPSLRVYRGGNLVLVEDDNTKVDVNSSYTPKFALRGLEHDVSYTAKPAIRFMNKYYDLDGYPFSSTTPTAAITDIVQTGSAYGSFSHFGSTYDYEFYFYSNAYLKGSENCREWGIYDPISVDVYNSLPLEDGRVTMYWTGWSNDSSLSSTMTPYVILQDGTEKLFESHSHRHTYGGGGPVMYTRSVFGDSEEPFVMRLDSLIINGHTYYPGNPAF